MKQRYWQIFKFKLIFILIQLSEMRGAGRLKNSHLWLNEPLRDIGDVRFFLKNKPIPY